MGEGWSIASEHGGRVDALEVGDWLTTHKKRSGSSWCRVQWFAPTSPDLDPCAMDVRVLWEGEKKPCHYRILRDQYTFRWAGKHRAVCEHCGGSWPCEPVRMQRGMQRQLEEDMSRCVVCGKSDGWTMRVKRETPEGVIWATYHTAKSRRQCRAELIRVASERELQILRWNG